MTMHGYATALRGYLDRRTPGYLVFFVTPRCDCRCKMCFNSAAIERAAQRQVLSLDEIEKLARSFHGLHNLNCSGGEPFLREDFDRIPELFYRHSGTRFITCPTNSSRPAHIEAVVRQILARCPRASLRLVQSLDGVAERHDEIRGKTGLFERVVELNQRLARLRERHPNLTVSIATALSRFNDDHVDDLLAFAHDNLAFEDMGALWVRGITRDPDAPLNDVEVYRRFQEQCIRRATTPRAGAGWAARAYRAANRLASELLVDAVASQRFVAPCVAGRHMVVIDDEGTVRPCEMLDPFIAEGRIDLPTARLGNVRDFDYDIARLLATDYARQVRHTIVSSRCACSYECALAATVLYNPALWLRALWRHGRSS